MRRFASKAIALAFVLVGCRLFVDLDGITGDAPSDAGTDAPFDAGRVDDANNPADVVVDTGDAKPPVSLESCVMLLHFDEPSFTQDQANAVIDSSGAGNHGTLTGGPATSMQGRFGGAINLAGASWVNVPESVSLDATQQLTVSAWVYPTGNLDGQKSPGIITKRTSFNADVAYTLFLWTNEHPWIDIGGTRTEVEAGFTLSTWFHVALVYDGTLPMATRLRAYVNGKPIQSYPVSEAVVPVTAANVLVGSLPQGGDIFVGLIDDAAIWTRALSDAEIAAIFSSNRPL